MPTLDDLSARLRGLDGKGYKAYKGIRGRYAADGWTLFVDHVQGDPFATPSRLRVHLPAAVHGIPDEAWSTRPRRVGVTDYLLRVFRRAVDDLPRSPGSGKSGRVGVSVGSPAVLERSGCTLDETGLTLRFRVGLPAKGRRILGRAAATLLTEHLPQAVDQVRWERVDTDAAWAWARTTEDHTHLQAQLADRDLVAFVRDGSLLPRASGVSEQPLAKAVPFESPPALRVTLSTLHHGDVTGMGVPQGVTVVTGGGFHGKTTLLEALQSGVHPHVPGDGREWVATLPDAVKVRSEDGRAVTGVDVRPFIHDLPGGRSTERFSTEDASGSTSLAAAILEALEVGTGLLLLDEDTSATNLLVRDARMQRLVQRETITPLIDRVRELAQEGVSTVLVTGGSGDYLDVADTVVRLEDYRALDATKEARAVVDAHPTGRALGDPEHPLRVTPRTVDPRSLDPRRRGRARVKARGTREIEYGHERIDVSQVEQLVEDGQARAVGALLRLAHQRGWGKDVGALARDVVEVARTEGLTVADDNPELTLPRAHEVAAALNRYRDLRLA